FTFFFLSTIVVYVINFAFPDAAIGLPLFGEISLRWLGIVPVVALAEILRKYNDDLYVLTGTNITHHQGRLSLNSSLPVLRYEDIRSITVNQGIWGRILDFGEVALSSAGRDGNELTLTGVRTPVELAKLIEDLRMHHIFINMKETYKPNTNMVNAAAT